MAIIVVLDYKKIETIDWQHISVAQIVYWGIISLVILINLVSFIISLISNSRTNKHNDLVDSLAPSANTDLILNNISDGIITIDAQGIIKLINPVAEQIVGWTHQDGVSLHYQSVIKLLSKKDEPLTQSNDPIWQALATNQQASSDELFLVTTSGKKINIAMTVTPIGQTGSGVIATFRDVTEQRAEEREKAEFISTASHEMRTPVAAINGYLGLAINPQTAQIDERARSYIKKAQDATEHLGELFQDLLDISKVDDGRLENKPELIDIVPFVRDITEGLAHKADEKGLKLIFAPLNRSTVEKIVMPSYIVKIDRNHIREIIDNLIENAIKYTATGQIEVDILGNDNFITLSVKDTGIGIPAEDIPHLFQKFYRVSGKQADQVNGNGLGLYLCRRLVETIGGRIWVDSKVDIGSTFFVELPRAPELTEIRLDEQARKIEAERPATKVSPKIEDVKKVPRSNSLSPEQIAEYVNKQRQLAQQQAATITADTKTEPSQPLATNQIVGPSANQSITPPKIDSVVRSRQDFKLNIPPRR